MSNSLGGYLLFGVTDVRAVTGCLLTQGVSDDIYGAAYDAHNVGRLEIDELDIEGTPVVAVLVH